MQQQNTEFLEAISSGSVVSPGNGSFELIEHNYRLLIERWFINPLRRMKSPDDGFIILMILFPLYEKHLRVMLRFKGQVSENSKFVQQFARDTETKPAVAYILWQSYRNGLLHHAMPEASKKYKLAIRRKGPMVVSDASSITINPFMMRDKLLTIIQADRNMWTEKDFPMALEYREAPKKK